MSRLFDDYEVPDIETVTLMHIARDSVGPSGTLRIVMDECSGCTTDFGVYTPCSVHKEALRNLNGGSTPLRVNGEINMDPTIQTLATAYAAWRASKLATPYGGQPGLSVENASVEAFLLEVAQAAEEQPPENE